MQAVVELSQVNCVGCGVTFAIPTPLEQNLRDKHTNFYCPNGHDLHYPAKSEAEKLREQLNEANRKLNNIERERAERRRKAAAARAAKAKKNEPRKLKVVGATG